jgi:hypothetical protein
VQTCSQINDRNRLRIQKPATLLGKGEKVEQEPTALPVTEVARQTPSGARPRIGMIRTARPYPGVGC